MRMSKMLVTGLVPLLLMSMAIAVGSTPWDGVPDDPTPAQAIWVDPKKTLCFPCETFVVDVLINITDPPGAGTGMASFVYYLFWNGTNLNLTNYTTHAPAGCEPPNGFLGINMTGVWVGGPNNGLHYHWHAYTCVTGLPFTGVTSLCTYTFHYVGNDSCTLDLQGVNIQDETATTFIMDIPLAQGTVQDGYVQQPIPGDINRDRIVDIKDVVKAVLAFGSSVGEPNMAGYPYDPWSDLNNDGIIDIVDLVIIGVHFGETDC